MQVLGIDIGFGFTKATNGTDTVIFKSLFGDASEMQFWADFGDYRPADHIHVTIDGKSYFIGDLAEQQSSVLNYTLDQEKLITDFVHIMTLTVAGMLIKNGGNINVPVNIVSGLPIGFYKAHHKRFNEILTGHHRVTYHAYDGRDTTKEIYINKVRMLPQPLGSLLDLVMDARGNIVNQSLATQKVGVVDIGFRTSDFTVMDHLRYIDRASRTMDTGISKGFAVIADKLREKCGISVELHRLFKAVESGTIKYRGQDFEINKIREQVYAQLASAIANDVDRLWADDWDIDTILLTGGGCRELSQHLQPQITGNVMPVDPDIDLRLKNVMGYAKYGHYVWGHKEEEEEVAETAEPLRQPEPRKIYHHTPLGGASGDIAAVPA
jgi:plasmid segregation protein ParM